MTNERMTKERSFCREVVDALPETALPELAETLQAMLDFYRARDVPVKRPSEPRKVPAKAGRSYIRPEFHIEDDSKAE